MRLTPVAFSDWKIRCALSPCPVVMSTTARRSTTTAVSRPRSTDSPAGPSSSTWLRKNRYAWPIGSWPPAPAPARHAGEERRPVRLCRNEPEPCLPLLELIDQVQLVVALDRPLVGLCGCIADRGQDQHQRGQPLLPVHDQVDATPLAAEGTGDRTMLPEEMAWLAGRKRRPRPACTAPGCPARAAGDRPAATCTGAATAEPGTASRPGPAASDSSHVPAPAEHRRTQTGRRLAANPIQNKALATAQPAVHGPYDFSASCYLTLQASIASCHLRRSGRGLPRVLTESRAAARRTKRSAAADGGVDG